MAQGPERIALQQCQADCLADPDVAIGGDSATGSGIATGWLSSWHSITGLSVGTDGKITIGGFGSSYFHVARYAAGGWLDTDFGDSGKTSTSVPYNFDTAGMAVQPDGKIVLVGSTSTYDYDFAVVRYNAGSMEQRLYVVQDANFNVTALVGEGGNVVERFEYDAYGSVTVLNADWSVDVGGSGFGWVHLHQGLRLDAVSESYDNRVRIYLPALGRFGQQDPLAYVDGYSLYNYVQSGPATLVDPLGLASRYGFRSREDRDELIDMYREKLKDPGIPSWQRQHLNEMIARYSGDYVIEEECEVPATSQPAETVPPFRNFIPHLTGNLAAAVNHGALEDLGQIVGGSWGGRVGSVADGVLWRQLGSSAGSRLQGGRQLSSNPVGGCIGGAGGRSLGGVIGRIGGGAIAGPPGSIFGAILGGTLLGSIGEASLDGPQANQVSKRRPIYRAPVRAGISAGHYPAQYNLWPGVNPRYHAPCGSPTDPFGSRGGATANNIGSY